MGQGRINRIERPAKNDLGQTEHGSCCILKVLGNGYSKKRHCLDWVVIIIVCRYITTSNTQWTYADTLKYPTKLFNTIPSRSNNLERDAHQSRLSRLWAAIYIVIAKIYLYIVYIYKVMRMDSGIKSIQTKGKQMDLLYAILEAPVRTCAIICVT